MPTDAYLPPEYVTKEELRLEAYRRLAEVNTQADVDDIRTEWEDRYGPLPDPAEALLTVGRLRAQCHRLGITEMQITGSKATGGQARLSPLELKLSEAMRLKRLSKGAILKEDQRQLVVPDPPRPRPSRVPRGLPRRTHPRQDGAERSRAIDPVSLTRCHVSDQSVYSPGSLTQSARVRVRSVG